MTIELIGLKDKQPKKKYDFKIDSSTPFKNPFFKQNGWNEKGKDLINYGNLMSSNFIKNTEGIGDKQFNKNLKKIRKNYKKYGKIRLFYNNKVEAVIIKNLLEVIL